MEKVRWTITEREMVLEGAVQIMHSSTLSPLEALRAAQTHLPAFRKRSFASHSAAGDLLRELRVRAANHVPKKKSIETPTPVESVPPAPPVDAPVMANTLDDLVNLIAKHIAQTFKSQIHTAIKELEHEFKIPRHDPTYVATGVHKPRVVVIGLLNDQVHAIAHEFSENYSLKFIDTDRAMGMSPPDADAYLLMKNFINHPLYHKYQKFPNHVLIDGGMTTLRLWLHSKGKDL
jgi:hypothetical protein